MKAHRSLFYLFLFLVPSQLSKHFFPPSALINGIRVDYLAPTVYFTDILICLIAVFWFFEVWKKRGVHVQLSRKVLRYLTGTFLFIFFNILFAISPIIAFLKWIKVAEGVFLTMYIIRTKPPFTTSFNILVLSGIYSSVIAWFQFIYQHSLGGVFYWIGERSFSISTPGIARTALHGKLFLRPYATFPHPNVLAGFLTAILPAVVWMRNSNMLIFRLLWLPVLVIFLSTIAITFSQSAWVTVFFLFFLVVVLTRLVSFQKVFLIVVLIGIFLWLINTQVPFLENESVTERLKLGTVAVRIIRDHLFFGVGLNNFIAASSHYQLTMTYHDLQPVHNVYLLMLSETGVVGFSIFMWLFWKLLRALKTDTLTNSVLMFSFSSVMLLGLVDHYPVTIQQSFLLGSILIGFIYASSQSVIHLHKGDTHGKRSK